MCMHCMDDFRGDFGGFSAGGIFYTPNTLEGHTGASTGLYERV